MGGLCWAGKCYPGRYPPASPWPIKRMNAGDMLRRYLEGQNVLVEYHWLSGQHDRLPSLIADLVRRRVAVIATLGDPPTLAAKERAGPIPIAFGFSTDPVGHGWSPALAG